MSTRHAKPVVHVVGSVCKPDLETEVEKWYIEEHFPMLLHFKELKQAQLYKRLYKNPKYPKYLSIYNFASQSDFEAYESSPELAAARKDTVRKWKA